jgi:hypothetical protein
MILILCCDVDHISFRSSCQYLNDQSHQRNDIGPRSTFWISTTKDVNNFERIASLHPSDIYYSLAPLHPHKMYYERDHASLNWSRITSLRRLIVASYCDASPILTTQTGLTSLTLLLFTPQIRYCTNLLELATPLPSVTDYRSLPTSLTKLDLALGEVKWSFNDDNVIEMMHHFPHLTDIGLDIGSRAPQFLKAGTLSSLSRWSSLTKLTITHAFTGAGSLSLDGLNGLVHNG